MATEKVTGVEVPSRVKKTRQFPIDEKLEVTIPVGFEFTEYAPIKRTSFAHDKFFFEHRAMFFEYKAAEARAHAVEAAKYGNKKQKAAAKRIEKMSAQIATLTASLTEQGIDVSELMEAFEEAKS